MLFYVFQDDQRHKFCLSRLESRDIWTDQSSGSKRGDVGLPTFVKYCKGEDVVGKVGSYRSDGNRQEEGRMEQFFTNGHRRAREPALSGSRGRQKRY